MSAIARARAFGIAEGQLGLVTYAQLRAHEVSDGQIRQLVVDGSLVRVFRAVYRVGGYTSPSLAHQALAACMACGDDAVASHRTAAVLRGLIDAYKGPAEIIVPVTRRPRIAGIRAYRRTLACDERTTSGLVPVTTVERTLLDVAGCIGHRDLEEAADRAFRARATTPPRMEAYLAARDGSPARGIAALRRIVDDRVGLGVPESILEAKMIALLSRFRLPTPVRQHEIIVRGRTVRFDLAYPDRRIAIELNGRSPHWGRERWQADHHRDNAVELADWHKIAFTWWDVTRDESYVAVTVAGALGLRPSSWRERR